MRALTCFLILLSALVGQTALGSDEPDIDQLHAQLLEAPDQATAIAIEDQIWRRWFQSGNSEVDALMDIAMSQRRVYDYAGALETLDRVIDMMPEYAEGWNQRATIHFFREEYEESLVAVAETLAREPRHFGALAGRAIIRLRQLKPALARQNMVKALKVNPWLRERGLFPGL